MKFWGGLAVWVFVIGAMLAADLSQGNRRQREPAGNEAGSLRPLITENQFDEGTVGRRLEA